MLPSPAEFFARLRESEGALVKRGLISEQTLMQRAHGLHTVLGILDVRGFAILPTREVVDPASCLVFRLVEYTIAQTYHSADKAEPGFVKDAKYIEGTGLSRESLAYLARVAEIGHELIPHLWLGGAGLRNEAANPNQHFIVLNEVWWLSRWNGVKVGAVHRGYVFPGVKKASGSKPAVDWRVPVLDGAIILNLEVKNRRRTFGSKLFEKRVYFFGDAPEKKFRSSGRDAINVLAITSYHGGAITEADEGVLVAEYLDGTPADEVIDAVALCVFGNGSRERIYFPTKCSLERKDLILRSLKKSDNVEDHSRIFFQAQPFPGTLEEIVARFTGTNAE